MKYVEQVKSIILTLLVLLSIALTFTIWTYTPNYETYEQTTGIEPIASTRQVEEVVRPLKILFHHGNSVTGTTKSGDMTPLLSIMKEWDVREIHEITESTSDSELAGYIGSEESIVLQYPAPVPFPIFDTFMQFSDYEVLEASFDRIVIDPANVRGGEFPLYFINTSSERIYSGSVSSEELISLNEVLAAAHEFPAYMVSEGVGSLPIYVPKETVTMTNFTYYLEEVSKDRFIDVLFHDPNVVRSSSSNNQFTDGSAVMRIDSNTKSLRFEQTDAGTEDPAVPSELVFNTLDFTNEHGGWTDDFRYFDIDPLRQKITYKLYVNDFPVFSPANAVTTEIRETWGNEDISLYVRPYYTFATLVATEDTEIVSGEEALAALRRSEEAELDSIQEVMPAYQFVQKGDRLVELKPVWYYLTDTGWNEITEEMLGGGLFGLE